MLKMNEIEIELTPDPDMYIFFEKGTRGGISYIFNSYRGGIQKVRSLRRGGGHLWNGNKNEQGEGEVLACVYVHFFNKNAEIFKMKFYSYSPVFYIDYNGSMKY